MSRGIIAIYQNQKSFLKIDIVEIISKVDIKGKELFNEKIISDYINNNILEINPNLK